MFIYRVFCAFFVSQLIFAGNVNHLGEHSGGQKEKSCTDDTAYLGDWNP